MIHFHPARGAFGLICAMFFVLQAAPAQAQLGPGETLTEIRISDIRAAAEAIGHRMTEIDDSGEFLAFELGEGEEVLRYAVALYGCGAEFNLSDDACLAFDAIMYWTLPPNPSLTNEFNSSFPFGKAFLLQEENVELTAISRFETAQMGLTQGTISASLATLVQLGVAYYLGSATTGAITTEARPAPGMVELVTRRIKREREQSGSLTKILNWTHPE